MSLLSRIQVSSASRRAVAARVAEVNLHHKGDVEGARAAYRRFGNALRDMRLRGASEERVQRAVEAANSKSGYRA